MTHVDFLVWFVRRYEAVYGLQLLENLFQSSFGRSFLVVLVVHQAFLPHLQNVVPILLFLVQQVR